MLDKKFLLEKYGEKDANYIMNILLFLKESGISDKRLFLSMEIAEVVIGLKLDATSIGSALIFECMKEKPEIENALELDKELSQILKMLKTCDLYSKKYTDADGLKEMLIAITKDIRVIIVKISEILVYAKKNVSKLDDEFAINEFKLIDDIYAPIAARLGLSEIKSELQDLSFKFHSPEEYKKLEDDVKNETRANTKMINEMVSAIKTILKKSGIECTCYGRIKHLSSIYNKIVNKNYTLKGIYDIAAVRILVENVSECYTALGLVHSNFVPVDGRFKDYIANPKPNGYQSLHTTVYFKNEFFEVQIRTKAMHEFAEYGVAAHFLYKEHKKSLAKIDSKLLWIRRILENKDNVSSEMILEELKTDVYLGEIFVQTPKGKIIKLVENATPIDFAYAVHSDVGNMCVGAKINGIMSPLTTALNNGDVVEILTSQNSKGPSRDWIKKVKMQSTKDKINAFFKKQMKIENIKIGKSMVEQYCKSNDIMISSIMQEKWIKIILSKLSFTNIEELYASIGFGSISVEKFVKRLVNLKAEEDKKNKVLPDDISKVPLKIETKGDIVGAEGMLTKYCKSCNPIPGDEIVGYVSRGRGIIIHKKDCPCAKNLAESRFIKVDWNLSSKADLSFASVIDVIAKNTPSIYVEITNAMSELSVKIISLSSSINKNNELMLKLGVLVKNRDQLSSVKNKLVSLANVYETK